MIIIHALLLALAAVLARAVYVGQAPALLPVVPR